MFIEVKNNCLIRYANWKFDEAAVETNANDNCVFDNGYALNNGIVEKNVIKNYAQKRLEEYPSLGEQFDMIYWDKVNGTNLWQSKIAEIKAKYPKE